MVCTALLATMTANAFIRLLTAADAPAYKTLHDTVLHSAPEAFVSDLASALARPAQAYVPRFGGIASGRFFLGAFCSDAAAPMLGCVGCERAGFTAWGREPRALRVGCAYHDKVHMMRLLYPTGP